MTAKRNRWLVGGVLIVALAAFLALSLLPILGGIGNRQTATSGSTPTSDPAAQRNQLEEQARGYEAVLSREPDNPAALEGLAETRIRLGDLEGVIEPLSRLAELNPERPEYSILLGQAKQQLGDLDGAAASYQAVLDQQPGNMDALKGLASLLVSQERPQAAIGLLQDTLKTDTALSADGSSAIDTTAVKLLLAEVYVADEQIEQALSLYDETIAANGEDFRPVLAKALVLQAEDRLEEARPLFAQAEAMAPPQYKDQISQLSQQGAALEAPAAAPEAESPEAE